MTEGTDIYEISKAEIENNFDAVGAADCNKSTKLTDVNVNASGDSDSSYEFVDELALDPVERSINVVAKNCQSCLTLNDVETQVDKNGLPGMNCREAESDCIVVGKSNGGDVVDDVDRRNDVAKVEVSETTAMKVAEPHIVDFQVTGDEVVELEYNPISVKSEQCQEVPEAESIIEAEEVPEPLIETFEAVPVIETEEVMEPIIDDFEAASTVESMEVRKPKAEDSDADSVVQAKVVRDPVVETIEGVPVVEVQEASEPVVDSLVEKEVVRDETIEAASVVKVQEREPVVEASVTELVLEKQEVTDPVEDGGTIVSTGVESYTESVESHTSEKNVILETDGSELPEFEEVKSVEQSESISNGMSGILTESSVIEAIPVEEAKVEKDPVLEIIKDASDIEVQKVSEPVVEASEAELVVEKQEVREPVEVGGAMMMTEVESNLESVESQTSKNDVILETVGSELPGVEEVREVKSEEQPTIYFGGMPAILPESSVIKALEVSSLGEEKIERDSAVQPIEAASYVEVQEVSKPVVEASESELVLETQEVREPRDAGGAITMTKVESDLETLESQTSPNNVILEADGNDLPKVEEAGEVKSVEQHELVINEIPTILSQSSASDATEGMPTVLSEGSVGDATDGHDVETEIITRPFQYLIRIPRFEDEKLGENIRLAKLQVDEKTQQRDVIRAEIQIKRANCQAHRQKFEAAKDEERTARRLVRIKRQEIDALQSVINRVKNALSVKDIDTQIRKMEHIIQHETHPLKQEKEFIREITRLRHLQEQLSSNMGTQEEVQQALDQQGQNEDHLKKLKKELETLKDTVKKVEAIKISAGMKYDEESKRLRELQVQFDAANDIRQEGYEHLLRLRGQLNEKHKNFRVYKDDAAAAIGHASRGDKEALYRLCSDQVEQLMKLWNTDDEFRKEYVRCNTRSTVRRFRTLDARLLGHDEEPAVLPAYVDERASRRLISVPSESQAKSIPVVANVEQENEVVSPVVEKQAAKDSIEEVGEQKIQTLKTRGAGKQFVLSGSSATVSGRDDKVEENGKKEEIKQSKEEEELARKAEELRKAEIAAKLKEQRRLEEIAKAKEAIERKKRNAEKAQMRAELRAQKEAEEKEKEREKRLRKKEKKKSGAQGDVIHDNSGNGGDSPAPVSEITSVKESEVVKESSNTNGATSKKVAKKGGWFWKQQSNKGKVMPLPPPLRNRNKRRMQQWLWGCSVAVIVLALFLLGNTGFFLNLKQRKGAGGAPF